MTCRPIAALFAALIAGVGADAALAAPAFAPAEHYPTNGVFSESLVLGDVDGDGDLDAVTANEGSSNISVLKGDGTGAFGPPALFASETGGGLSSSRIAGGDVDGDGDLDVVVTNTVNVADRPLLAVLRNDGTGDFSNRTDFFTGRAPLGVVVTDIVGGPEPDIATANFNSTTLSVLAGDGLGGFAQPGITVTGTPSAPEALDAGDFDRDGLVDIVLANRNAGSSISIRRQSSPGVFTQTQRLFFPSIMHWVRAVDLNGDGALDVIASSSSGAFGFLINDGTGFFPAVESKPGGGPDPQPDETQVADLDADGDLDLAAAHSASDGYVTVHAGQPGGGFDFVSPPLVIETENHPTGMKLGDVNGDGRPDLVTANSGSGSISVLINEVPPETTITAGPSGKYAEPNVTNDRTPVFSFTSSAGSATFECSLDGGAFAACTSPYTAPSLADGAHSFKVRSIDSGGNVDPTPAVVGFLVEPKCSLVKLTPLGIKLCLLPVYEDAAAASASGPAVSGTLKLIRGGRIVASGRVSGAAVKLRAVRRIRAGRHLVVVKARSADGRRLGLSAPIVLTREQASRLNG